MCVTSWEVIPRRPELFDSSRLFIIIFMGLICEVLLLQVSDYKVDLADSPEDEHSDDHSMGVVLFVASRYTDHIVGIGEFRADGKRTLSIINGSTSVALPYFMYGFAITDSALSYAPILSSVENVATTLLATAIPGNSAPWRVVGIVLVIISIAMINMPRTLKMRLKSPGCE